MSQVFPARLLCNQIDEAIKHQFLQGLPEQYKTPLYFMTDERWQYMFEQVLDAVQHLTKTLQQDKHLATSREASKPTATSVIKKKSSDSATHWGKGKLYPSRKLKRSAKAVVARQATVKVLETENSGVLRT